MSLNKTAEILLKAHTEFANVKRNPSGTPNGNAVNAIFKRTRKALVEAGETVESAQSMTFQLCRKVLPCMYAHYSN